MFKIENFSSTLKIETIGSCESFVAFHLNSPHYIEVDYIEFPIVTVWRTSKLKSSLFWDCTQRRLVVCYRRFGTTCPYHLQGSSSPMNPTTTNLRCVKSQKREDGIHTAAESCNHATSNVTFLGLVLNPLGHNGYYTFHRFIAKKT